LYSHLVQCYRQSSCRAGTPVPGALAEDYIRESEIAPDVFFVHDYHVGVMPTGYQDALEEDQHKALVDFF